MSEEIIQDLDNIPIVEGAGKFDVSAYDGYKTRIASVTQKEVPDYYASGDYDATSTAKKQVVEIATEPLKEIDKDGNVTDKVVEILLENGTTKKIVVTHRFNLQSQVNKEGKTVWVISKHPKASLWKFMKKKDVAKLSELKGKQVILTTVPSRKPEEADRKFLAIVVA